MNPIFRARAKITSHFRIPSSGHLWPRLNRKILEIVLLFLWFCSIGATKSGPNPDANSVNLFLREPLLFKIAAHFDPLRVKDAFFVHPFVGMSAKVVALRL